MTNAMLFTMVCVAVAVVVTLFLIQRYPRKIVRRRIICPEESTLAEVRFLRREVGFGDLAVVDIVACSLFQDRPITCQKQCMK